MRLAFWRAGKDKPEVQRAMARPAPSAPKPFATSESGDLDLQVLGHALMRKRSWIIVPTVLALVASLAAVNMITPRYKSEARILIDGRENVFLRPNGERDDQRNTVDPEAVTSQVQLLLSRDLAREIIRKNRLAINVRTPAMIMFSVIDEKKIDATVREFLGSVRQRPAEEARKISVEFLSVIFPRPPRQIVGLGFTGTIPAQSRASAFNVLFARRLTKREERFAIAETQRHDRFRLLACDQIVEQRQIKSRRPAGIKFRLESEKTRELADHQRSSEFGCQNGRYSLVR